MTQAFLFRFSRPLRFLFLLTLFFIANSHALADAGNGDPCGGERKLFCGEGLYCHYPVGNCGMEKASGTCKMKPELCTLIYMPVCGCDGKVYGNECAANSAGQSVLNEGECKGDLSKPSASGE